MSLKRDEWPAKAIGFMATEVIEMAQKIREICDTAMVPSPDQKPMCALQAALVSIALVLMAV